MLDLLSLYRMANGSGGSGGSGEEEGTNPLQIIISATKDLSCLFVTPELRLDATNSGSNSLSFDSHGRNVWSVLLLRDGPFV